MRTTERGVVPGATKTASRGAAETNRILENALMLPRVGDRARRSLTLTQRHVETFAELTGETVLEGEAWCYTMTPEPA